VIIATAGHVDHGKTHLVRALTGVDTDRLEEEKRRGMTIDLGFAYADLGGTRPAGFIDVPGHERFVRTMAAGVHHLDLALLVVAADDGPMPQTREHLSLLQGLGLARLAVVITKIDRVDVARRMQVQAAVLSLLQGTPLEEAPCFEVDNLSGQGIHALRQYLCEQQQASEARAVNPGGHARLAIDRAFSLPGAGLIVTGLLLDGRLAVGDALQLSPQGQPVRVRGLRVHEHHAEQAEAGQRCAVNLAGAQIAADAISRGDWLVSPELGQTCERLDVWFKADAAAPKALSAREQLQLHLGASCVGVRIAPLSTRAIAPGETGLVQLILDQPLIALHADRFVLRDPAAQCVLGHGGVLDPFGAVRGRSKPDRLAWLSTLAGSEHAGITAQQAFGQALLHEVGGVDLPAFSRAFNLREAELTLLLQHTQPIRIGRRALSRTWADQWQDTLTAQLRAVHAQQPARVGPTEGVLLRDTARACAPTALPAQALAIARWALQSLLQGGQIVREGHGIRCADHVPVLPPLQQARLEAVRLVLAQSGLRPPIAGELAEALNTTREDMLAFLKEMGELGHLVPVAPNRYFLQSEVEQLAAIARELAERSPQGQFDAAAYRDASGIGRNLTIEVLEFLDRQGITRRIGQKRVLRDGN
jgi:selenocysteine-specific elongation factor